MVICLLCNGLTTTELTDCLKDVKSSSKNIGTHSRRELYWNAYGSMITAANKTGAEGERLHGWLTYHTKGPNDDETVKQSNFIACTKRQKGLLGSVDFFGKKTRPEEKEIKNNWCIVYLDDDKTDENEAQAAFDDITSGEPMVYYSQDMNGIFVGTRLKRRKCRNAPSNPLKTPAELQTLKESLKPEEPLVSVAWEGHRPPSINDYNFILAGGFHANISNDESNAVVNTTSIDEIYACFVEKKNLFLVEEASKFVSSHLVDVSKGGNPLFETSVRLAGIARKACLLKKVFIDSSKKKFIDAVNNDEDNNCDMVVIDGAPKDSLFTQHGGCVFELHYHADLAMFGA